MAAESRQKVTLWMSSSGEAGYLFVRNRKLRCTTFILFISTKAILCGYGLWGGGGGGQFLL